MEKPIIETVIEAALLLKKSKLDVKFLSKEKSIISLNHFFETSTVETILLVSIYQLSADNNHINREDLAEFLDCNPLLFFKYEEQFNALLDRGLLENETKFRVAILRKRKIYRI